ncbi:hypothetical protein C8J57DRAFT_1340546 [Mycena rebaudengoi]|nr:hypothetical protein C8J57DRAFT_1340546 [Mycena rebaudengoi]
MPPDASMPGEGRRSGNKQEGNRKSGHSNLAGRGAGGGVKEGTDTYVENPFPRRTAPSRRNVSTSTRVLGKAGAGVDSHLDRADDGPRLKRLGTILLPVRARDAIASVVRSERAPHRDFDMPCSRLRGGTAPNERARLDEVRRIDPVREDCLCSLAGTARMVQRRGDTETPTTLRARLRARRRPWVSKIGAHHTGVLAQRDARTHRDETMGVGTREGRQRSARGSATVYVWICGQCEAMWLCRGVQPEPWCVRYPETLGAQRCARPALLDYKADFSASAKELRLGRMVSVRTARIPKSVWSA